ncbi:MAG TPA: hypothetical protein VF618_28695 [Thermoanaerobaculia bacterium]
MDLSSLVDAVRLAHAQAVELARAGLSPLDALEKQQRLLEELSACIGRTRAQKAIVAELLSDRMNNMLMAVQTATDLLRRPPDAAECEDLRRRLLTTIDSGRESLRRIHAGLAELGNGERWDEWDL